MEPEGGSSHGWRWLGQGLGQQAGGVCPSFLMLWFVRTQEVSPMIGYHLQKKNSRVLNSQERKKIRGLNSDHYTQAELV